MTKVVEEVLEDPDVVVADAVAAADEAQALVTAIEDRIVAGDPSVSHDDWARQISVARFAAKFVEGARTKAQAIREANADRARASLAAEVLRDAPANGERLLTILDRLIADSKELMAAADSHDENVRRWAVRARELDVPDKGVTSAAHANMGVSAGGDVLVGDVRVQQVGAKNVLRLLFMPVENGIILTPDQSSIDVARSVVANLGKAAV